jgi:acetyltransferase-like isoleucine patch superfamily enzyme
MRISRDVISRGNLAAMQRLIDGIRWKLVAGWFGRLVQEIAHRPYVYDGSGHGHERVFVGNNVKLDNVMMNVVSGDITIGDDSFFGSGVSLLTGTHDYHVSRGERQSASPSHGRDIVIGRGVWIASDATILGPCRIGDDAVIAAGAVVALGEVPPGAIVGGVPGQIIGHTQATA